jgi:hypothetical protein
MARIRIDDLPPGEPLSPEQEELLFGAGFQPFRPMFEALEAREMMDAAIGQVLMSPLPHAGAGPQFGHVRMLASNTQALQGQVHQTLGQQQGLGQEPHSFNESLQCNAPTATSGTHERGQGLRVASDLHATSYDNPTAKEFADSALAQFKIWLRQRGLEWNTAKVIDAQLYRWGCYFARISLVLNGEETTLTFTYDFHPAHFDSSTHAFIWAYFEGFAYYDVEHDGDHGPYPSDDFQMDLRRDFKSFVHTVPENLQNDLRQDLGSILAASGEPGKPVLSAPTEAFSAPVVHSHSTQANPTQAAAAQHLSDQAAPSTATASQTTVAATEAYFASLKEKEGKEM